MSIDTYTELQSAIADWLNRDDLVSAIPSFISLAEADMNRKVKHWRMDTVLPVTLAGQYTALPADWVATTRLNLTTPTARLDLASDGALAEMRFQRGDLTGKPTHYAHTAGSLEVFPTPNASYAAELVYRAKIASLSGSVATNWLLTAAPDAYLYGALMQAAPYLKDDARIAIWGGLYAEAITGLNAASDEAKNSAAGLRLRNIGMR
jgi:hypothetical protein